MTTTAVPLDTLLARWVADGLVSAEQAAAIRDAERDTAVVAPPEPPPESAEPTGTFSTGHALLVEAFGYLGGVVILVAAGLVTARFWGDLSSGGRVALCALATVLLVGVGLRVPRGPGDVIDDPGRRLCAVLLGLGVAGAAVTLGLLANELLDLTGEPAAMLTSGGSALAAAVLAWRRPAVVQQVATVVPLAVGAGVLASLLGAGTFGIGLAIWLVGPAWYALGTLGLFGPRRADAPLAAAVCVVGAVVATPTDAGIVLGLVTTVAVVALALTRRDLLLLGVGALAAFLVLPSAVATWFPGSVAAPLALLVVGFGLLAVALTMARTDRHPR
jgi:hypothetical protein